MLPFNLDALANEEDVLYAQLEAAELQVLQLQNDLVRQSTLLPTLVARVTAVKADIETKRQTLDEKIFFCGLINGRLTRIRSRRSVSQESHSSESTR